MVMRDQVFSLFKTPFASANNYNDSILRANAADWQHFVAMGWILCHWQMHLAHVLIFAKTKLGKKTYFYRKVIQPTVLFRFENVHSTSSQGALKVSLKTGIKMVEINYLTTVTCPAGFLVCLSPFLIAVDENGEASNEELASLY